MGARRWCSRGRVGLAGVFMMLVLGVALGGLLAACGSDTETTTTLASTTSTAAPSTTEAPAPTSTTLAPETTTTVAETTTTTEALSSAEILLPDGSVKAMGYIDRVWESGGKRYIRIDYAELLTGEEAQDAAIEEGYIGPGEDLPNDYFIVNVNPMKREFVVSPSVELATSTRLGGGMDEPATWAQFKNFWSASPPEGATHLHKMPWWIVRSGEEVLSIKEQYLP